MGARIRAPVAGVEPLPLCKAYIVYIYIYIYIYSMYMYNACAHPHAIAPRGRRREGAAGARSC